MKGRKEGERVGGNIKVLKTYQYLYIAKKKKIIMPLMPRYKQSRLEH